MLGNVIATLIIIILIVIVVGWALIQLLSRSYVKTTANMAFVRTGGLRRAGAAEPLVVVNGAAWVFGFLHRIKWVSLATMAVEVRHVESNAAVTNDPQYVDIEARFFVKVKSDPASISIAAQTIGGEMVDEAGVRRLAEPKLQGAVRDVAATFSLTQLLEKRIEFVRQVQEHLREDLAQNGLALDNISILTLRPTLQGQFSTDDILGAQVARANAAVIEKALTEKNRLENQAALQRARQGSETERERMAIDEALETERAERAKNIALVRASEEAAAKVVQEQKREEAERARLLADRALLEADIENERLASLLREQAQRAVELEQAVRAQEVALAEQEREKRVAEATAVKLEAIRRQIEADKLREQALQEALTLTEKSAAEREAELELINARLEAEKQAIASKNAVELEAMRLKEMAEAEQSVAALQAEATHIRAEAELDAAKKAAIGERERQSAAGLAEVQVAMERTKVMEQEAEAIRRKLIAEAEGEKARVEALASHDALGHQLELTRINVDMLKAIEIARAQALGEAISGMKMNLYGDATTARHLLQLVATAQSAQHVYDALPDVVRDALEGLAKRLGSARNAAEGSGSGGILEFLDLLVHEVQAHFPDALDQNPTLGELVDRLGAEDGAREVYQTLHRLVDHPGVRELPLQTALSLAQAWLGWEGPQPDR